LGGRWLVEFAVAQQAEQAGVRVRLTIRVQRLMPRHRWRQKTANQQQSSEQRSENVLWPWHGDENKQVRARGAREELPHACAPGTPR
jgi:hypothetical protein